MNLYVPILKHVIKEIEAGRPISICTVVETEGSTPQTPGAMMVIDQTSQTKGTIGGGCVEAEIRRRSFELLQKRSSALVKLSLDHDFGWDDGLICGGTMTIAVTTIDRAESCDSIRKALEDLQNYQPSTIPISVQEKGKSFEYKINIEAEPSLVIAGAGHIGQALANLCVGLEFHVTVIDNRADYANVSRFPPPINVVVNDISTALEKFPIDPVTYIVIVTRGHKHDEQALEAVIRSPAKYIGMIGSKRKVKLIYDGLQSRGITPEMLNRVHSPIGLPINAVTVPEIMVSIAAELIATRRTIRRKIVEGPF
ncbi:XdhC family protein [bacterium]|nr:XdhC family protein [bacterium]